MATSKVLLLVASILLACLVALAAGADQLALPPNIENPAGEVNLNPNQQWTNSVKCLRNQSTSCPMFNETGELIVTDGATYCGACSNQTMVVLKCIDVVKHDFMFKNKATTGDVRNAINTGCSTGNFTIDVSQQSTGTTSTIPILTIVLLISVGLLLLP